MEFRSPVPRRALRGVVTRATRRVRREVYPKSRAPGSRQGTRYTPTLRCGRGQRLHEIADTRTLQRQALGPDAARSLRGHPVRPRARGRRASGPRRFRVRMESRPRRHRARSLPAVPAHPRAHRRQPHHRVHPSRPRRRVPADRRGCTPRRARCRPRRPDRSGCGGSASRRHSAARRRRVRRPRSHPLARRSPPRISAGPALEPGVERQGGPSRAGRRQRHRDRRPRPLRNHRPLRLRQGLAGRAVAPALHALPGGAQRALVTVRPRRRRAVRAVERRGSARRARTFSSSSP